MATAISPTLLLTFSLVRVSVAEGFNLQLLQLERIKQKYLQLCPYPLSIDYPDEHGIYNLYRQPVVVNVSFVLARLVEIDDVEKRLSLFGEVSMYWSHPCNTTCQQVLGDNHELCSMPIFVDSVTFVMPKTQTWYPKFLQMNGFKQGAPLDSFFEYVNIGMFPSISYVIAIGTIDTACDSFSFKRFPFDILDCDIQFYTIDNLSKVTYNITHFMVQDDLKLVSDPDIWEHVPLMTANKTLFSYIEGIKDNGLSFKIKFQRKYQYFVCSIVLPTIALAILQIGGLIMPPEMPDRSSYAITVVLAYMLLLSMVFSAIPRTSEPVYFVYMVTTNLWAGVVVTLYSLTTCELSRRENWLEVVILSESWFKMSKIRLLDMIVGVGIFVCLFLLDTAFYIEMLR